MYLDNSLNKLLPSCLLLPLLLRVISVLIVFLSIWSHCFSGLFLCYFLSSKINYEHPSELGARDTPLQEGGVLVETKSFFFLLLHNHCWMCVWEPNDSGCGVGTWCLFRIIALTKSWRYSPPHVLLFPLACLLSWFMITSSLAKKMHSADQCPHVHSESESRMTQHRSSARSWQSPQSVSLWLRAPK